MTSMTRPAPDGDVVATAAAAAAGGAEEAARCVGRRRSIGWEVVDILGVFMFGLHVVLDLRWKPTIFVQLVS